MGQSDVYRSRKNDSGFEGVPWTIYFTYISGIAANRVSSRHYSYSCANGPIKPNEVLTIARLMATNATRTLAKQFPQPDSEDWNGLQWKRKSWFVIVVDVPGCKFNKGQAIDIPTVGNGVANHTFFDCLDDTDWNDFTYTNDQGNKTVASGIMFRNYMKKNEDGDDLPPGWTDHLEIELKTTPQLRTRTNPPRLYPDSGGDNLGPPVPPP
jgi:hypothetical protein